MILLPDLPAPALAVCDVTDFFVAHWEVFPRPLRHDPCAASRPRSTSTSA